MEHHGREFKVKRRAWQGRTLWGNNEVKFFDLAGLDQSGDKRCINNTLITRQQGPPEHLCRRNNDPVSRVAMEPGRKRRHSCRNRRRDTETLDQRGRLCRFQPIPQGELQRDLSRAYNVAISQRLISETQSGSVGPACRITCACASERRGSAPSQYNRTWVSRSTVTSRCAPRCPTPQRAERARRCRREFAPFPLGPLVDTVRAEGRVG